MTGLQHPRDPRCTVTGGTNERGPSEFSATHTVPGRDGDSLHRTSATLGCTYLVAVDRRARSPAPTSELSRRRSAVLDALDPPAASPALITALWQSVLPTPHEVRVA